MIHSTELLCEIPDKPAKAGWTFDLPQVEEAIRFLDLRYFVSIRFSSGRYRVGTHYARIKPYPHHRIIISQIASAESANETLWHELRHGFQSERWAERFPFPIANFPLFYKEAYKPARGRHGASYRENRYEIDCREFAEKMSRLCPLLIRADPEPWEIGSWDF